MRRINVLLTREPEGGLEPFRHDAFEIVFHVWSRSGPLPLLDAPTKAFVEWLLPDMPGIEACRRLRCDPLTAQSHIVMVLEEDDRDARRKALAAGADDYFVGRLTRTGVLDRILATLPHGDGPASPNAVRFGELTIDPAAFQARWKGRPLPLMPNELRLLRYFIEHPGRVFTRSQLIAALGKHGEGIDERTVDVWIGRLRRALRAAGAELSLRTVRSLGYVLDQP